MGDNNFYSDDLGWRRLLTILEGRSALDSPSLDITARADADDFLASVGFNTSNAVEREELERLRVTALRFVRDELLPEVQLQLPPEVVDSDAARLLVLSSTAESPLRDWCCAMVRAMHLLRHCKNHILERYGDAIREQVLAPFERIVEHGPKGPRLGSGPNAVPLSSVEVQRTKSLYSVATKLLRRASYVGTDIEDYIGVRFITETRFDAVLVLDFLLNSRVLSAAAFKPERVRNTLFDPDALDRALAFLDESGIREPAARRAHLHREMTMGRAEAKPLKHRNPNRSDAFKVLLMTARKLIRARDAEGEAVFFFPYEIQILDKQSYHDSVYGPASHKEYRKRQRRAACERVLGPVLMSMQKATLVAGPQRQTATGPVGPPAAQPQAGPAESQFELFSPTVSNEEMACVLEEVAEVLDAQRANPYRVEVYRSAAETVRKSESSIQEVALSQGREALIALPRIGKSLSGVIDEIATTGKLNLLARLRGEGTPVELFATIPGVGEELSARIHSELQIDTLEELEVAAHDGRLDSVAGFGPRRLEAIQRALATMLHRSPRESSRDFAALIQAGAQITGPATPPPRADVATLLRVDREFRVLADQDALPMLAPRRNNPSGEAWLPVWHTELESWRFTVLYSNTDRAHALGRTHDWVVIYTEHDGRESQCTVITERAGELAGRRVVRGRERECREHYDD